MNGYAYNELEPKADCPYCGARCHADFVDNGVGFQQCGPYFCEACKASEIGIHDEPRELTPDEERTGWYAPESPLGSSVNQENGRPIPYWRADTVYRAKCGVPPRYDDNGRFKG